jgi:hypothetical protein
MHKGRRIASPGLLTALLQNEKAGRGLSSTLGFRLCNLVLLSPKSNLYPGRRPKRKTVPKVKIKISGKAVGDHGAIFAD